MAKKTTGTKKKVQQGFNEEQLLLLEEIKNLVEAAYSRSMVRPVNVLLEQALHNLKIILPNNQG